MIAFKRRLKSIDPRLSLVLCDGEHRADSLRAGFYYILRKNDDGTVTFWEVSGRNGEFCEPSEAHLEALRKVDASRTNQRAEREAERRRKERAKEHRKEFDAGERQERMKELLEHRLRLQVRPGRDV